MLQSTIHQSWRSVICPNAVIDGSRRAMFWHSPSNLFRYLHGLHHHSYLSAIINEFINIKVLCGILPSEGKKYCAWFAERTEAEGRGTNLVSHGKSRSGARRKASSCEPKCRTTTADFVVMQNLPHHHVWDINHFSLSPGHLADPYRCFSPIDCTWSQTP